MFNFNPFQLLKFWFPLRKDYIPYLRMKSSIQKSNYQPATRCTFHFNPSMQQTTAKKQSSACTRAHSSILISFITLIISSLIFNLADWEICARPEDERNKQTEPWSQSALTTYLLLWPAYCTSHPQPSIYTFSSLNFVQFNLLLPFSIPAD